MLAHVLPFVAGAVNASGFVIVGAYTSHVTGSVARVGEELAQRNVFGALQAVFLVLSFLIGAAAATALLDHGNDSRQGQYARPLAAEAATLLVVMLLGIAEPKTTPHLRSITTALLCFAMGLQNALVTRLSGAVVRTTHLTGVVTDIGIETVRAYAWLRALGLKGVLPRLLLVRSAPELAKLRLHCAILLSFSLGALMGPYLYLSWGYLSMALPLFILGQLILFDRIIGLRGRLPIRAAGPALEAGE